MRCDDFTDISHNSSVTAELSYLVLMNGRKIFPHLNDQFLNRFFDLTESYNNPDLGDENLHNVENESESKNEGVFVRA